MAPCGETDKHAGVLVVDDDADLKELLAEMLRGEGFAVTVASNGHEALHVLQKGLEPCVILLDLMMPVMDGWQFRSRQMEDERLRAIPTVVFTGASSPREEAGRLEAHGYLSKTADIDEILRVVHHYC